MATISEPLFSYAFLTGIAGAGAAVEWRQTLCGRPSLLAESLSVQPVRREGSPPTWLRRSWIC